MKVSLRKSELEDCAELRGKLREEDLAECAAAGITSYGALRDGYDNSEECVTGVFKSTGEVIAMFGVAPVSPMSDEATVWFLGSRRLDECKFEYLHLGRAYMAAVLKTFRRASNYCLARSVKSIRFLKLLGFRFVPEKDVYVNGNHWVYFEMEA